MIAHAASSHVGGHAPNSQRRWLLDDYIRLFAGPVNVSLHCVVALSCVDAGRFKQCRVYGMDLGGNGMRRLWHHRISRRPRHSLQHPWEIRGIQSQADTQPGQRMRKRLTDRAGRPGLLERLRRTPASKTPPSQSSFPRFIVTGFIESNPASFSQVVVSRTEYVLPDSVKRSIETANKLASSGNR